MRRFSLAILTTATVLGTAAPALATHPVPPSLPVTVNLDSYHPHQRHFVGPVTGPRLNFGRLYVASVQGTLSYYAAFEYVTPKRPWNSVCGTPEAAPLFPTPARTNGKVGFDAQFVFARPWRARKCARKTFPLKWTNFEINTRWHFRHVDPLGGPPAAPSPTHTYAYGLVGRGAHVQFRLRDRYPKDNYGVLKVTVRAAIAADCAGTGWESFGTANQAACVARIGI